MPGQEEREQLSTGIGIARRVYAEQQEQQAKGFCGAWPIVAPPDTNPMRLENITAPSLRSEDQIERRLREFAESLVDAWRGNRCTTCPLAELAAQAMAVYTFYKESKRGSEKA